MKKRLLSVSVLPFLVLTTYGAYTAKEILNVSNDVDRIQKIDIIENDSNEDISIPGLRFVSRGFYLGDLDAETELVVEGSKAFDYDIEYDEYDLQIDYSVPGIYTVTATIKDWDGVVIGTMKANKIIFDNTFYEADEIWGWYEEESEYDYNGTPRAVKIKKGVTVPTGFSHSWPYAADGDEILPWPTEGGLQGKELNIYYQGTETGGKKALVLFDRRYTINILKVIIDVSYPNTLIFTDQLPYEHTFTYKGDLDVEQVRKAPFRYRLDNKATGNQSQDAPIIDGKTKKQYTTDVVLGNNSNFSNILRTTSIVSVIDRMEKGEVAYDGNNHMTEAKAIAQKVSVDGLSGVTATYSYKDQKGQVVTEIVKGGVYTIEGTYTYPGATSITDTTTFTIKKKEYTATPQTTNVKYNGEEQVVEVDFSNLPQGVKLKEDSPKEIKGIDVDTYTQIFKIDGGDEYEDFDVEVTLKIDKGVLSITPLIKEVTYTGSEQSAIFDEGVLPKDATIEYTSNKGIDAGTYNGKVIVTNSKNYEDTEIGVTLTIGKADITGVSFPTATTTYDTNPHSIAVVGAPVDSTVVYTYEKDGVSSTVAPIDAGEYTVKAIVTNGDNYKPFEINSTLTIGKADITGVSFPTATITYDANPHSIAVVGAPVDSTVVYTYDKDGVSSTVAPTDAGEYTVKAVVTNGDNYKPFEINSTLTIGKADITGVSFPTATTTYDTNPHSIAVVGAPVGSTVVYSYSKGNTPLDGEPTEAGEYTVTAIVKGGNNYEDTTLTSTITITKAPLKDITIGSKTVAYTGSPVSLEVEGNIPTDGDVDYAYTDKEGNVFTEAPTEAGEYTVTAIVKGGNNYDDTTLTSTITITKAPLKDITIGSKTLAYTGSPVSLEVEGNIPSDGDVDYTYTDKEGNVFKEAPTEAGEYTVTAIVKGGNNYEDTTLTSTITITKAPLKDITIDSKTVAYTGSPVSLEVEGNIPADGDVDYTYTDKEGNVFKEAPTEAGEYTVTAIVKGGNNYEDTTLTSTITITKAPLKDITIGSKTVAYTGSPVSLEVEGNIPSDGDVTYTYKNKEGDVFTEAPTEAGEYTVTVIVKGGNNYEDTTLTSTITITKAPLKDITIGNKTVAYTGSPVSLEVEGNIPADGDVTYTYKNKEGDVFTEAPTEAGEYTVTVIVKGGNNYEDTTLTSTITITKAPLKDITIGNKTVAYTGSPVSLEVEGNIPADGGVDYTYTDKEGNVLTEAPTEAGEYTVTAIVKGGNNYDDTTLTSTITITKAPLKDITIGSKTVAYTGSPVSLEVEGNIPADGDVTYTYTDKEGNVFTEAPTEADEYKVTAIVKGGKNYEDTTLTSTITITKAPLKDITIDSKTVGYTGSPVSLEVEGNIPTDGDVDYTYTDKEGNVLTEAPTEAGEYTVTAIVKGGNNYDDTTLTSTITITKAPLKDITIDSKTLAYTGSPVSLEVEGNIPADGDVDYTYTDKEGNVFTEAPTEAGEYKVTAIVKGGKNYDDTTLTSTITITKAPLKDITIGSKTLAYTGSPVSLEVEGNIPADGDVDYTYTDKEGNVFTEAPTEAGEYKVTAIVKGGKNYEDTTLTSTITITKAPLKDITIDSKTVAYTGSPVSLEVEGNIPADGGVDYTYTHKDGTPVKGEPTEAGEYTVTAIVKGGNNYDDTTLTSTITITKAPLTDITIGSKTLAYTGSPVSLEVEGNIPTDGDVDYTYTDKEGNVFTEAPTEAGEYKVTAIVKGGNNYDDTTLTSTITITKAPLKDITIGSKTLAYTGSPVSLEVEGNIPVDGDVDYTYTDKEGNVLTEAPTEAGEYTVTAIVKGGKNYDDTTLTSTITITKAPLKDITIGSKTLAYTGSPVSLEVEGNIPVDGDVTYTYTHKDGTPVEGEPTEAGEYTVTAIVKGGNNYEDTTLTSTITITKALINNVAFNGKTVVYNGNPQEIKVSGELPEGVEVSYENNVGTNAGDYKSKAILKGGNNYEDLVLETVLSISKANITGVSFVDKVVSYNKKEQIIEIIGELPTGVSVLYEKAKQTEVGVYNAIARINGGINYHDLVLEAKFEIKEDRVPSKDAAIHEFLINGISFKNPGEVIEYTLEPTAEGDDAEVRVVSFSEYSSLNVPDSFIVDTSDPRVYYTKVTVTSEDGKTTKTYTIKLIKPIEDRLIILQKFQNTLLLNNNPSTNGGYTFVSYQWYKNGVVVGTKQSYSVGQGGQNKLDPKDDYYLIVRTDKGEEIHSTRIDIYEEASKEIKLYPNPVSSNDMTTNIMVDYSPEQFEKGRVEILTVDGRFIYRQELFTGENRIVIPNQVSSGIYLAVIDINGKKQTIRFTIK